MKVHYFTYVKTSGDSSTREVVEVHAPNTNMAGYDITEMQEELFPDFVNAYNELMDKHKAELLNLLNTFDLNHAYKQFKPEGIKNRITEFYE